MHFDFIVVGAGSAGCVVASRLVNEFGANVLVLEQGPADNKEIIHMPAGTFKMLFGGSPFVKHYASVGQPNLGGRSVPLPQGNVLGGGSSINVMNYARGSKLDYDLWDKAVNGAGWAWEDLLPYFRKQEGNQRLDNTFHGGEGPLKVSDGTYRAEVADIFVRTMQRMGLPYRHDMNNGDLFGAGYIQMTMHKARRCSAADAFLHPASENDNITVITGAKARRILFEGTKAKGIEFERNGKIERAYAEREIVLTAGALATPKLLMLSGVGASEELNEHGIDTVVDLPGVGKGLQDHNTAFLVCNTNGEYGYFGEDTGLNMIKNGLRYLAFKDGPVASNGAETMAFLNIDHPDQDPDIQLYCVGVMWPSAGVSPPNHGLTLIANLVKPKSRGSVRLRSADPNDDPLIDPNWLSEKIDEERLVRAFKYLREIAETKPLSDIIVKELFPSKNTQSDAAIAEHIKQTTESNYHPVSTCRMGLQSDKDSVLDEKLRVYGTEGLRVMDASMMPQIISANTNATVMAVADRGVDLMMA